jgi:outer membrane protein assembly factor BamA
MTDSSNAAPHDDAPILPARTRADDESAFPASALSMGRGSPLPQKRTPRADKDSGSHARFSVETSAPLSGPRSGHRSGAIAPGRPGYPGLIKPKEAAIDMFPGLRRVGRRVAALGALLSLVLSIVAGPLVAVAADARRVVSVSVSGNAHVPTDRILSVVKTRVGEPFDEATVREDLQAINDLGYFADQVPPLIRQRPDGISVTFRVIENPIVQRITFTGNEHVPSDTLLALMDTSVGQVLNMNTFHQDVLKINSYYDKIGYGGQVPTHVVDLNIDKETGVLRIDIREGLTVRHIIIQGAELVLPPPVIKDVLSLKEGQPYSEETRDKDFENVKKLYEKYDLNLGEFEVGIDPGSVDLTKGTADVLYTISAMTVGAVMITGNDKTKDVVIRRQLRLRPGMVITTGLLRRDYERLNNLGFFEKVEPITKPGPDPRKPYAVTLDWSVKEQRTGQANIGAGYSGGPSGTGLTGNIGFSENNLDGTGNGAAIRFERGARITSGTLSYTIPFLGNSPKLQKYSLGASIYAQATQNYLQAYAVSSTSTISPVPTVTAAPAPGATNAPGSVTGTTGITLQPNSSPVNGVVADYQNSASGISVNLGRRLTDYISASVGVTLQSLSSDTTVPFPYYVYGNQTVAVSGSGSTGVLGGTSTSGNALGITASGIASIPNGEGTKLRAATLGLQSDTLDDVFYPRRGGRASLTFEGSGGNFGSSYTYTITTLDVSRFYPVLKNATLGFHLQLGTSTGAIPSSKLFAYSEQQLRGYTNTFYGTNARLGQVELRYPLTPDRKFAVVAFGDLGSLRIRGAVPITNLLTGQTYDYNNWIYHGDAGVGLRVDVPQFGHQTVRLDFARGAYGTHTSFGIGQSF